MQKDRKDSEKSVDFRIKTLRSLNENNSSLQDNEESSSPTKTNRLFRYSSVDERKLSEKGISNISLNYNTISSQKHSQPLRNAIRKISTTVVDKRSLFRLKDTYNFDEIIQSLDNTPNASISDDSNILRINVSGCVFEAYTETFEAHPNTLLGDKEKRSLHFIPSRNEVFFDRCRRSFMEILSYYQHGEIHRPDNICLNKFVEELQFYQLDNSVIQQILYQEKAIRLSKSRNNPESETKHKLKIRNALNVPSSSNYALCIFIFRIIIHIYLMLVFLFSVPLINSGLLSFIYFSEIICNVIIFIDVCLNLYSCQSKRSYLLSFYTVVDIFSIFSCALFIMLTKIFNLINEIERTTLITATRALQLFRLLQLFRYSRSNITNALGRALRNSTIEILSIFLIINILSIFFGSLLYFMESTIPNIAATNKNGTNMVQSMWDGIWLALVTMTTVGYGDLYPHTYAGRIVAVVCTCFGQVIICMIIPIVSNLYQEYYKGRILEDKLLGSLHQRMTEERHNESLKNSFDETVNDEDNDDSVENV